MKDNNRKRVEFSRHALSRIKQRGGDRLSVIDPVASAISDLSRMVIKALKHERDGSNYINLITIDNKRYILAECENKYRLVTMVDLKPSKVLKLERELEEISLSEVRSMIDIEEYRK